MSVDSFQLEKGKPDVCDLTKNVQDEIAILQKNICRGGVVGSAICQKSQHQSSKTLHRGLASARNNASWLESKRRISQPVSQRDFARLIRLSDCRVKKLTPRAWR